MIRMYHEFRFLKNNTCCDTRWVYYKAYTVCIRTTKLNNNKIIISSYQETLKRE